jgi:hypothetical protein
MIADGHIVSYAVLQEFVTDSATIRTNETGSDKRGQRPAVMVFSLYPTGGGENHLCDSKSALLLNIRSRIYFMRLGIVYFRTGSKQQEQQQVKHTPYNSMY